MAKILIVEDESNIVDILRYNLEGSGYETLAAYDGAAGLELALTQQPDLILLDIMLPKMDGYDVCRSVRAAGFATPIIMLTAREDEMDKVLGLDLGADDYITKPFSMRELMARVGANIRRTVLDNKEQPPQVEQPSVLERGRIVIDLDRRLVYKDGALLELTSREFDLLHFLAQQDNKVFSREQLMEQVWNYEGYVGDVRAVDVAVRRLREKLEDNPADPCFVITRRGAGYLFQNEGEAVK